MDDPQPSVLIDPQAKDTSSGASTAQQPTPDAQGRAAESEGVQQVSYEEQQQPPATAPPASQGVQGPRSPVTVEALPEFGGIIISGQNQADVAEIERIIRLIESYGRQAEVKVELIPLQYADATSVAATLTALYQRVTITATSTGRSTVGTQTTTTQGQFGQATTSSAAPASVVLLPLPRFNAILLAAPQARMEDVKTEIKRLDKPTSPDGRSVTFQLKKAPAARTAALITNWYNQRYPNESAAQHQIRIQNEDSTNTLLVQAAPADLDEIRHLIDFIETNVPLAVNDVRIIYLRNALSDEIASLLSQAIAQGVAAPSATAAAALTTTAVAPGLGAGGLGAGGLGAGGFGAGGLGAGGLGAGGLRAPGTLGTGLQPGGVTPGAAVTPTTTTPASSGKSVTLRFISTRPDIKGIPQSGLLEDIHITSDPRINGLIISSPAQTMDLILALIRDLDVPAPMRAEVKVFSLQRADAGATASQIQQLFLGTSGTTTGAVGGGALPGAIGGGGGLGGGGLGAAAVAGQPTLSGAAIPRALFTLGGVTPEGAPLIPLGISVDPRTNSLIIAGSRNDLDVIESLIYRLEDTDVEERQSEVYHLHNASAVDVANALQTFLTNSLNILRNAQQITAFQEVQRDVVIIPEPITNKLLISTTARYFHEVQRLIAELDAEPPQVVIQVLIAEVDLNSDEEFGVEIGLQSPVLFRRSIIPRPDLLGTAGTVTYTTPATGTSLVPPGVTVNSSINPAAQPGFLFNNVALPLGNNPMVDPGIVGFQGLTNLGVGRASSNGIGGFVFSASSQAFNLLIRALKTQGRLDLLSRPQIQTLDNQTATINVGQDVPYVTASNITATGIISNSIAYRSVGVILTVTPRISPDGTIVMRVIPEVSKVSATQVPLGNGNTATAFDTQHVETTVFAQDGQTVAIGGLITKRDERNENKVPWLGDLPYVGALFRYRTQVKSKTELMVIMTPHIVRTREDADRILAIESRRMDWCVGNVVKIHGTTGLEPILSPLPGEHPVGIPDIPPASSLLPDIVPGEPEPRETLPAPRGVPKPPVPATGTIAPMSYRPKVPPPAASDRMGLPSATSASQVMPVMEQPVGTDSALPMEQAKEKRAWKLNPRDQ
jgi:type II secretion system protein D